jgi:CRP/FNR family transcriptional regulator, cyclic AMP receptor protein
MAEARGGQLRSTLRRVQLFSDCSGEELALTESLLTRVDVSAGTAILSQGQPGRQFFVITQGYARVTRNDTEVGVVGPGSFVGEMALLNATTTSAAVTAITALTAYVLEPSQFQLLIEQVPSVDAKVRRAASERASDPGAQGATR